MSRLIRRTLRSAIRLAIPHRARIVFRENQGIQLSGFPVDPLRSELVLTHLMDEGLADRKMVRAPHAVSMEQLLRVHEADYLEELDRSGGLTRILGLEVDDALHRRILELQRIMVGGTLLAARIATERRRLALHLGGGLHHAHAGRGSGFCIFNDVAIAIHALRHRGYMKRILVIDLDLHDGDGTRALFADDPTVHTFSIHNRHWGSIEGEESTSIALGTEVDDELYLGTLRESLPSLLEDFRPDLVFYLAGCDPADDDRIGDWCISAAGMLARDRFVCENLQVEQPATVVLTAGGYGREAWRYTARFLALLLGEDPPREPAPTEDVTLARYRHMAQWLEPGSLTGAEDDQDDDDWGLTEADLFGDLGAEAVKTRFLDYYSVYGAELATERLGFTERLRSLGFSNPTFAFDLSRESGDTARIWSSPDRKELLAEIRARRDRSFMSGYEVLFIEWLLLQNPRADFDPRRPRLPGQAHPGLGLLRDVAMLFVLICDRLQLDGVAFVPSHYHVASQARGRLHFLEPEHEALFRALQQLFSGLNLPTASGHVHREQVVDARDGKPLIWQPMPMVLPVSEKLTSRIRSDEYEEAAVLALESIRLKIRFPAKAI